MLSETTLRLSRNCVNSTQFVKVTGLPHGTLDHTEQQSVKGPEMDIQSVKPSNDTKDFWKIVQTIFKLFKINLLKISGHDGCKTAIYS